MRKREPNCPYCTRIRPHCFINRNTSIHISQPSFAGDRRRCRAVDTLKRGICHLRSLTLTSRHHSIPVSLAVERDVQRFCSVSYRGPRRLHTTHANGKEVPSPSRCYNTSEASVTTCGAGPAASSRLAASFIGEGRGPGEAKSPLVASSLL